MKELFLLIMIALGGYFAGTQLRDRHAAIMEERGVEAPKVQRSPSPQQAARVADNSDLVRNQAAVVKDLKERLDESNQALEVINVQLNRQSGTEPQLALDQLADQITAAQAQIQQAAQASQGSAEEVKQRLTSEEQQAVIVRQEELITAQRMRDRLAQEQAVAAGLRSYMLQLLAMNMDTDALRLVTRQYEAQESRVRALQQQYQSYELQSQQAGLAAAENRRWEREQAQVSLSSESAARLKELRDRLQSLEAQYQAKQREQQTQRDEYEKQLTQYQSLQIERDDLLANYDKQKQLLEEMKSSPQTGFTSPTRN